MGNSTLFESIYAFLKIAFIFIRDNIQSLINLASIAGLILLVSHLWFENAKRELVMFVGVPGSSAYGIGVKIADNIEQATNPSGTTYNITVESTPESLSIRERASRERNRISLALVEDGTDSYAGSSNENPLQILLPLEWDYLFVLASKKLCERAKVKHHLKCQPTEINEVLSSLSPGKLYMGHEKSSTYSLAEKVLEKYDSKPIDKLATGISDWRDVRSGLKNGELELVFIKAPVGSELLDQIASDDSAVLIGIGEIGEAIQSECGFKVYAARLPMNLCSAKRLKADRNNKRDNFDFCAQRFATLASRRVLVCTSSLSATDAFVIASVAQKTCIENQYHINLKGEDLPLGSTESKAKSLKTPIHSGLKLLIDNSQPFIFYNLNSWPYWVGAGFLGILGIFIRDLVSSKPLIIKNQAETG